MLPIDSRWHDSALLLQAMDNSIGNMGKQLGSLLKTGGQQSSSLQQQTPTVDAANAFQQVVQPCALPALAQSTLKHALTVLARTQILFK